MPEFHPYQEFSPNLLMTLIRIKGAEAGFNYFYPHFKKKLDLTVRYTLNTPSCTDQHTHGEDIRQVVLLTVKCEFDKIEAGTREDIADPIAYFSTASRNYCLTHLKVCRQMSGIALEDVSEADLHKGSGGRSQSSILDVPDNPEKLLERKELLDMINKAIGKLGPESELLLRLRVQYEYPYEQIALRLGITPECARKRYSLLLRELKRLINSGRVN